MSRSAEDQELLEQRIQAMKLKNEELRRRHMEVEADKQTAAKQNALVKMNVPLDDDWIPGRHDDNPRHDRDNQVNEASESSSRERSGERYMRHDQRRNRNDGQREDNYGYNRHHDENPRHFQNSQNVGPRRVDLRRSDGERFYVNDNIRSGDWSKSTNDGPGGRPKEWVSHSNRGHVAGDRGHQATFPSKVFKNSSMEPDRTKRPTYRLAEGDGPPPDPSYSFLGDSMRDSPQSGDRKRGQPIKRGFPRGRGRGGQSWNIRPHNDSKNDEFENRGEVFSKPFEDSKQQSYDAWRRERNLIDQERINRQKSSDGTWSREWDNNKVLQEGDGKSRQWRKGNDRGNPRRGFQEESRNPLKQNYSPRSSSEGNTSQDSTSKPQSEESSGNKFIRRGRFSNQSRLKDSSRFSNGSIPPSSTNFTNETTKEVEDALLIESNVKTVEQLKVSVVCDTTGTQKRCVEGVGGNLCINLSQDGESSESKSTEQKRPRKSMKKGKRKRVLSSTSTGTSGITEDDESWEDLSSDEENVSILTDLQKIPSQDLGLSKSIEVSSGPESLDPIPAPGKEDEFLWDDFHPAGFQDNATLDLDAEAAYKALLDEKAKQEGTEENESSAQTPKVSFRLDTSCLNDSDDESDGTKLDPLLVTTQIVQAEVDCMSLTSLPTDTSLPEDLSQFGKIKSMIEECISEQELVKSVIQADVLKDTVSAEELSGPLSILAVPSESLARSGGQGEVQNNIEAFPVEEQTEPQEDLSMNDAEHGEPPATQIANVKGTEVKITSEPSATNTVSEINKSSFVSSMNTQESESKEEVQTAKEGCDDQNTAQNSVSVLPESALNNLGFNESLEGDCGQKPSTQN